MVWHLWISPAKVDLINLTLVSALWSECSSVRELEETQLPKQGAAVHMCSGNSSSAHPWVMSQDSVSQKEKGRQTLPLSFPCLISLCCPIYQHVQGPDHAGDGNDMESDRAEDFPPSLVVICSFSHCNHKPITHNWISNQGNFAPHLYPRPRSWMERNHYKVAILDTKIFKQAPLCLKRSTIINYGVIT